MERGLLRRYGKRSKEGASASASCRLFVRRWLRNLSDEMAKKLASIYYSDAREALLRALGDF